VYSQIMIPVDLAHRDRLSRALKTGGDLARHWGAKVVYVSVTGTVPSQTARSPDDYARELEAFAAEEAKSHGIEAEAKTLVSNDPAVELDHVLVEAARDIGADLIVMGTHEHHAFEWPSHGGRVAGHTGASVMLVRDK